MPSQPRYLIIDDASTFHVTWQCHNKDWLLKFNWAKQIYYRLLLKYKDRYGVLIYSYCFMSNHPHLTGFCQNKELFSDFFRIVNSQFARIINKQLGRRGQVVMDRFKSPKIETDEDLLKVMTYIDLNPKRARMTEHPKDYAWTSFHYYAYGKEDPLITPAPSYLALGFNSKERQNAYLELVENVLKNDWKEKKPYSSMPFIGNPDWVLKKNLQLRASVQSAKVSWKERFRQKFTTSSP
ncbi:MAG TPA: transposase [Deltaproteobacteria bacterium]|nr:transposase [Deltaproteobacteria bacterium]